MGNYEIRVVPKKDISGKVYWTASFPAIDGCIGGGNSAEEAINEAEENLEVFLAYLLEQGRDIPTEYSENQYSGKIALRVPKSIHQQLIKKAGEESVSLNMIINSAISHYLGLREYEFKLDQKINEIRNLTRQSLNLQKENFIINQQLLWDKEPLSVVEGVE